ncbi:MULTISPECIES: sensor histidine kinase [unclassified Streptomyces]|uniref:sensor histidine kinase n=1 Tax=unclassified Streptomyces TaxID=2593676 RepID=UPI0006F950F6|nr:MULTISPECIES: sensor histidine kinase [unclassified Streptomyces]KQX50065.1 nickel transporter [Streptomyces sp. Root1304]KRA79892.1 nickel transporter [Streptomyces sp. Root66D1]
MRTGGYPEDTTTQGDGWLRALLYVAFLLLLGAALTRFLVRHTGEDLAPWVVSLAAALALLYVLEPLLGPGPSRRRHVWLGAIVAVWLALVILAPSFGWCSVPLFFIGLRTLRMPAAIALIALVTAASVTAHLRLAGRLDIDVFLAPPAIAAIAIAVFVQMDRQTRRQRELIDDLIRTRRELAATERREGTLAERQRLSMEIHDSLAQGLSSQQMLLQAADRVWEADPATARTHVLTATSIAEHNLTEARRFVHDLAPADLADGGGLDEALRTLAARETGDRLTVHCHVDGTPAAPLPERVQSALLRIAQGALANVREHSGATTAALSLTYLDDQVVLDVSDNGRGFDPAAPDRGEPAPSRGHGLPAIRTRAGRLGGELTIESAPGEGTVLSAAIPLHPSPSPSPEA